MTNVGRNVLRVLKACGAEDRGIYVYGGASEPLIQAPEPSSNYYGVDGLGDAPEVSRKGGGQECEAEPQSRAPVKSPSQEPQSRAPVKSPNQEQKT